MKLLLASNFGNVADKLSTVFEKSVAELKIIRIPTAVNVNPSKDSVLREKAALQSIGMSFHDFDIADKTVEQVTAVLQNADVIYVTGGNTYYLMEQMTKCDFGSVVRDAFQKNVVYMGASAGAIVVCPTIDFIDDLDDQAKAELGYCTGLGLIDFLVMPHIDHPKYQEKIATVIASIKTDKPIFGLRDDQFLHVQDNYVKVI